MARDKPTSIGERAREVERLNKEAHRLNDAGDPAALFEFEKLGAASEALTAAIERACGR